MTTTPAQQLADLQKENEILHERYDFLETAMPDELAYIAHILGRIQMGAAEYGDKSFELPFTDILDEQLDEAADLAGWGFVIWHKIRVLKAKFQRLEGEGLSEEDLARGMRSA